MNHIYDLNIFIELDSIDIFVMSSFCSLMMIRIEIGSRIRHLLGSVVGYSVVCAYIVQRSQERWNLLSFEMDCLKSFGKDIGW